jgi:nucleotide-binding universal stress UspA family protein
MSEANEKIVIAFDGTEASVQAIKQTSELMGTSRELIILTIWEPGLMSNRMTPLYGDMESPIPLPDGKEIEYSIQAEREHAGELADWGVQLAQQQGLKAISRIEYGSDSVSSSIIDCVRKEHACLLVIGAHRHGALASALLGSTTQSLLHQLDTPMLVVRPVSKQDLQSTKQ